MTTKLLAIPVLLLSAASCAGAQVTTGRTASGEIAVRSDASDSKSILSTTQVQTKLPNGRLVDGSVITLYDPGSQLFWWTHQKSIGPADPESARKEFLGSYRCSVFPDEIACFTAEGRTLWSRISKTRVSSAEEGLAAVRAALPGELAKFESGEAMWFTEMPLAQTVGRTFFHPKNPGDPAVRLTIERIERLGNGWRVDIRNDKGESTRVAVSRDFKVSPATVR
jgi:hypothetical protein